MTDQKTHILAIGGHAGDMDLTAGAVIAKYTQEGHRATFLHLTPGEKGHPRLTPDEYGKQKIEEAQKFAEIVGADVRFLSYKDAELPVMTK
nr:PIG-L family deacetylase [Paenibacillus montanisoli]